MKIKHCYSKLVDELAFGLDFASKLQSGVFLFAPRIYVTARPLSVGPGLRSKKKKGKKAEKRKYSKGSFTNHVDQKT